jgi:signal transduction histidine kinase
VKRIMERLGGSIEIESEVGIGTVVHLYFPIVKPFPEQMLLD